MASQNLPENSSAEPRLSPMAAATIADFRRAHSLDQRIIVPRRTAMQMLSVGQTRLLELEKSGQLHSLLDGASRRITVESIYEYLIGKAVESHPLDAPPARVRQPSSMKKRRGIPPRQRTEQELAALQRANLKRAR